MSAKGSFRAWLSAWAPALPLFAVVLFGLLAPTAFLMLRSVVADGQLSLDLWSKMLGLRNVQRGIITSLELGLVCATITTIVGVPLAWLVSRTLPVRRSLWLGIFNVAAHFGGIGLAFAYVVTLGTFGMITLLVNSTGLAFDPPPRDSFAAIVMTMQYSSVPLLVLLLVPAMGMLREQWWEAAQTSSASRLQFWRRIGLPVLMPFVAAGFVLVFTWTIGSYTVPYALAGQSPAQPVQLITLQIGLTLSDDVISGPARAGVLSIVLMALAVVALLGYRMLIRRGLRWFTGTADDASAPVESRSASSGRPDLARLLLFGAIALYLAIPILAVVLFSVATRWTNNVLPDGYTPRYWQETIADPRLFTALTNSFSLAAWVTTLVIGLVVPAVYWGRVRNPRIRPLLALSAAVPFSLPYLVIALAVLQFSGTFAPSLLGTYGLLVITYVALTFPFAFWAIDGAMGAVGVGRMSEAAATCGASQWQTLRRVILPNIGPGLATGAMLVFAVVVGEFAVVNVIASSVKTIPVWMAEALRDFGGGVTSLAVVTTVLFALMFALSALVVYLNRGRLVAQLPGVTRPEGGMGR